MEISINILNVDRHSEARSDLQPPFLVLGEPSGDTILSLDSVRVHRLVQVVDAASGRALNVILDTVAERVHARLIPPSTVATVPLHGDVRRMYLYDSR